MYNLLKWAAMIYGIYYVITFQAIVFDPHRGDLVNVGFGSAVLYYPDLINWLLMIIIFVIIIGDRLWEGIRRNE